MSNRPTKSNLHSALAAAGSAHHDYETVFLQGVRDEQWAGWYAAYVLGRLGAFATPSQLTDWLQTAPTADDWAAGAATFVLEQLERV